MECLTRSSKVAQCRTRPQPREYIVQDFVNEETVMHVVESVCASEQPAGGFYRLKDVHSAERRRRALRLAFLCIKGH